MEFLLLQLPVRPIKAVPHDPVAYAARDIELAAADLMRSVSHATTVDAALKLQAIATILRNEVDRVVVAALDRAEAICAQH